MLPRSWSGLALLRGRPTTAILDPSGMLQSHDIVAARACADCLRLGDALVNQRFLAWRKDFR
jgi:hypothetical protein